MGFYGKIINYLTKAFSKININNKTIQAEEYDDTLTMQGDDWISLDAQDKTILITHESPSKTISNLYNQSKIIIDKPDIGIDEDGSSITIEFPAFDDRGHATQQTSVKSIDINIASEIQHRIEGDTQVQNNLNVEIDRAKQEELKLSDRIGQKAQDDIPATGIYVEIDNVRSYVDETKQSILGEDLTETFDTLKEIAEWIEGPGVNTTELTEAIATETAERKAADELLHNRFENLNETDNNLKNSIIEHDKKILALEKENIENKEVLIEIPMVYESKTDALNKLSNALSYTDEQLSQLNRQVHSVPNRYLSDIAQTNGLIEPVFQDLPFDFPKAVNLEYDEESGNLSFPSYFKTYPTGQAPAFIYVYDGGEI